MDTAVRCPYCAGLMESCSTYIRDGLYAAPSLVYLYKCTECGSSSPPVRPVRGWWSMGGGHDTYGERARREAWEKAVVRKAKFDDAVIFGGGNV